MSSFYQLLIYHSYNAIYYDCRFFNIDSLFDYFLNLFLKDDKFIEILLEKNPSIKINIVINNYIITSICEDLRIKLKIGKYLYDYNDYFQIFKGYSKENRPVIEYGTDKFNQILKKIKNNYKNVYIKKSKFKKYSKHFISCDREYKIKSGTLKPVVITFSSSLENYPLIYCVKYADTFIKMEHTKSFTKYMNSREFLTSTTEYKKIQTLTTFIETPNNFLKDELLLQLRFNSFYKLICEKYLKKINRKE
jgi:hypothetical protein